MARNGVENESLHHERFNVEQIVAPRHWQDLPVKHLVIVEPLPVAFQMHHRAAFLQASYWIQPLATATLG